MIKDTKDTEKTKEAKIQGWKMGKDLPELTRKQIEGFHGEVYRIKQIWKIFTIGSKDNEEQHLQAMSEFVASMHDVEKLKQYVCALMETQTKMFKLLAMAGVFKSLAADSEHLYDYDELELLKTVEEINPDATEHKPGLFRGLSTPPGVTLPFMPLKRNQKK